MSSESKESDNKPPKTRICIYNIPSIKWNTLQCDSNVYSMVFFSPDRPYNCVWDHTLVFGDMNLLHTGDDFRNKLRCTWNTDFQDMCIMGVENDEAKENQFVIMEHFIRPNNNDNDNDNDF